MIEKSAAPNAGAKANAAASAPQDELSADHDNDRFAG
jgi:hypothetical protein